MQQVVGGKVCECGRRPCDKTACLVQQFDRLASTGKSIKNLFQIIDRDGSGAIGPPEMDRALKAMVCPAMDVSFCCTQCPSHCVTRLRTLVAAPQKCFSPEEIYLLINAVDADGSGDISHQEFTTAFKRDPLIVGVSPLALASFVSTASRNGGERLCRSRRLMSMLQLAWCFSGTSNALLTSSPSWSSCSRQQVWCHGVRGAWCAVCGYDTRSYDLLTDTDKDGKLTLEEFTDLVHKVRNRYPLCAWPPYCPLMALCVWVWPHRWIHK